MVIRSRTSIRIGSPKVSTPSRPAPLGLVHGRLGVGQQLGGASSTPKVLRATPTEASRKTSVPATSNGCGQCARARSMKADGAAWARAGRGLEQGQELVASEAGHELGIAGHPRQAPATAASTRSPVS